jgi:hypothetical protein
MAGPSRPIESQFSPRHGGQVQFSPRANNGHPSSREFRGGSSRRSQRPDYDPLNYSHSPERHDSHAPSARSSHRSSHRTGRADALSESTLHILEIEADAQKRIEKLTRLEEERLRSRQDTPGLGFASQRSNSHASLHRPPSHLGAIPASPSRPSSARYGQFASPPPSPGSFALAEGSFHVSKQGIPSLPGSSFGRSTHHTFEQSLRGSSDFHIVPDSFGATLRRGIGTGFPRVNESDHAVSGMDDRFLDGAPGEGILEVKSLFVSPDGHWSHIPVPIDDDVPIEDGNATTHGHSLHPLPSIRSPAHRMSNLFTDTFALPSQAPVIRSGGRANAHLAPDGSALPPPLVASLSLSSSYIQSAAARPSSNHSTPKRSKSNSAKMIQPQAASPAHSNRSESEQYLDDSIQFESP